MNPAPLEPLVLAQAASACDVDEDTLATAVALALLPDGPDRAVPGWWDDAPCAGLDPNDFYPVRGQATAHLRSLCADCPVKAACLASALYNGEMHGWWGGTSANGRKRLRVVLRTAGVMGVVGEDAYLAWREDGRDPPDLAPARYPARQPWPHQLEAVAAVIGALDVGGRCQVSMATASGKTHVAVWSASSLGVERVLVLVPSLALIAQTADVWSTDAHWGAARRLAVCSDTGELELEATTDPATVAAFLDAPGPAIVFATYHSSEVLVAAARRFDLTVADEAHHLAGEADKAFAPVLRGEIPTDRTLFMTATPRRFRRSGGDSELVGMDAEVFGPRVFDFPLSDAVAAGVVADYRVIVAAVERKVFDRVAALPEMEGIDPYLLAGAIAVVRTMGQMRLGSCVSFHTRVDRARSFAQLIGAVADALGTERPLGHGWSGFVHGDTSVRIRRRLLARLADDRSWGVLANAKALGEGVDMPALDAVAIVDPKNSETDVMPPAAPYGGRRRRRWEPCCCRSYWRRSPTPLTHWPAAIADRWTSWPGCFGHCRHTTTSCRRASGPPAASWASGPGPAPGSVPACVGGRLGASCGRGSNCTCPAGRRVTSPARWRCTWCAKPRRRGRRHTGGCWATSQRRAQSRVRLSPFPTTRARSPSVHGAACSERSVGGDCWRLSAPPPSMRYPVGHGSPGMRDGGPSSTCCGSS